MGMWIARNAGARGMVTTFEKLCRVEHTMDGPGKDQTL